MCYDKMFKMILPVLLVLLVSAGIFPELKQARAAGMETAAPVKAVAVLHPTEGSSVRGVIYFTRTEGKVAVTGDVNGLTPGLHGFHVHELGDCSAPDGTSAGGHFNPENKKHGAPAELERHVGDLGNLEADANGRAFYNWQDPLLVLSGPNSIIGRAVIVHAGADDLTSQPTGAAGGRAACGVIGITR